MCDDFYFQLIRMESEKSQEDEENTTNMERWQLRHQVCTYEFNRQHSQTQVGQDFTLTQQVALCGILFFKHLHTSVGCKLEKFTFGVLSLN